jgi:hypothetical protein
MASWSLNYSVVALFHEFFVDPVGSKIQFKKQITEQQMVLSVVRKLSSPYVI